MALVNRQWRDSKLEQNYGVTATLGDSVELNQKQLDQTNEILNSIENRLSDFFSRNQMPDPREKERKSLISNNISHQNISQNNSMISISNNNANNTRVGSNDLSRLLLEEKPSLPQNIRREQIFPNGCPEFGEEPRRKSAILREIESNTFGITKKHHAKTPNIYSSKTKNDNDDISIIRTRLSEIEDNRPLQQGNKTSEPVYRPDHAAQRSVKNSPYPAASSPYLFRYEEFTNDETVVRKLKKIEDHYKVKVADLEEKLIEVQTECSKKLREMRSSLHSVSRSREGQEVVSICNKCFSRFNRKSPLGEEKSFIERHSVMDELDELRRQNRRLEEERDALSQNYALLIKRNKNTPLNKDFIQQKAEEEVPCGFTGVLEGYKKELEVIRRNNEVVTNQFQAEIKRLNRDLREHKLENSELKTLLEKYRAIEVDHSLSQSFFIEKARKESIKRPTRAMHTEGNGASSSFKEENGFCCRECNEPKHCFAMQKDSLDTFCDQNADHRNCIACQAKESDNKPKKKLTGPEAQKKLKRNLSDTDRENKKKLAFKKTTPASQQAKVARSRSTFYSTNGPRVCKVC